MQRLPIPPIRRSVSWARGRDAFSKAPSGTQSANSLASLGEESGQERVSQQGFDQLVPLK